VPVEEQTVSNQDIAFKTGNAPTQGQRLTIANREVSKLAFYLGRIESPTGSITFTIRKIADKSLIASKVWGLCSSIPTEFTWLEATFDSPVIVNEEVRILAEYSGYNDSNYLITRVNTLNPKANEVWTKGTVAEPAEPIADWDACYKYTWDEPPKPAGGGGPAALVAAGII